MTEFTQIGSGKSMYYRMDTNLAISTAHTLSAIRDIGGLTQIEAVGHAVSYHSLYTRSLAAGKLLVARIEGKGLSVLEPPAAGPQVMRERTAPLHVNVNQENKDYLAPHTRRGNPSDLVALWHEIFGLYSRISEKHALHAKFLVVEHDFRVRRVDFKLSPNIMDIPDN